MYAISRLSWAISHFKSKCHHFFLKICSQCVTMLWNTLGTHANSIDFTTATLLERIWPMSGTICTLILLQKKNIVLMTVRKIYKVIWSYDKVKSRIHRTITQFDYPIWIVAYVNGCVMIFKWIVSNTIADINWFTVFYGWLRPCIMADLSTQLLNFDANSHRSRWTTDLHSWTVPSIWFLALILLLASFISKFSQITLHLKYQNKLRLLLIWMHAFIWMRLFVWLIRKSIALASAKNHCAIIAIFREKLLQLWIMDIFIHPK